MPLAARQPLRLVGRESVGIHARRMSLLAEKRVTSGPYMDLAAMGHFIVFLRYPWTTIHVGDRHDYFKA